MATKLLALTANVIAEADLPIMVYFESAPEVGADDERDFLTLEKASCVGYNGLPVFSVTYASYDGIDLDNNVASWSCINSENFMSEYHARAALLERAHSPDPSQRSTPSARTQLAELVPQSFEKTLGQPGASLGSILSAHLGQQLSLDPNERRDQLFAAFVSETSVDYDGQEAHQSFYSTNNRIWLPVWKWLEIKAAYTALCMLDFYLRGDEPTWEQIWDSSGFSTDVNTWLDDVLSDNPDRSAGEHNVSAYAVSLQSCFRYMADVSLSVQEKLAAKAAA